MLSSSSPESAYHMAAVAHLSAISSSLPFINFFDGFRTSHEINKIKLMDLSKVENMIDKKALQNFRKNAMNNTNPNTRGTAENDDIYFQNTEARNKNYQEVTTNVVKYMDKINKLNQTNYKPFNYYGDPKATSVIIAIGSVCATIKETIDYLNTKNGKYGLIEVHLYRPFSTSHLIEELPKTVTKVAVLDRTKEPAANGEPLYLDVVEALKGKNITIIGGRYGLSSKNTTPAQIKAVYEFLNSKSVHHNFTIGIEDDVTNLSLKVDENFHIPSNKTEFLIYGYGSDGMVSTSKDLIKISQNVEREKVYQLKPAKSK